MTTVGMARDQIAVDWMTVDWNAVDSVTLGGMAAHRMAVVAQRDKLVGLNPRKKDPTRRIEY